MIVKAKIWRSLYQDSVILMRIASEVRALPGLAEAAVFMGTPANLGILAQAGLDNATTATAGPNDLLFSVRAENEATADQALAKAHELLTERRESSDADEEEVRPRTLETALRRLPGASLVLISVPGAYARFEAEKALKRNLHVMIFSDNVAQEDEIALKTMARERGLLCMGPDCGTAYLNGVGLAFYNVIKKGRIGCVAASGTGLQAVVARLDFLGEGISHGIGVGGRDLSPAVDGLMTFAAIKALAADSTTAAIIVISKPVGPALAERLDTALRRTGKPAVVCCVGAETRAEDGVVWVATLDEAADAAQALLEGRAWRSQAFARPGQVAERLTAARAAGSLQGRGVHAYYTGGTLAHEALAILEPLLGPARNNLGHDQGEGPHLVLDLGDDAYTVGRPHPMIEPAVRIDALRAETARALPSVVIADLVLGKGAHADPASPLAEEIQRLKTAAKDRGDNLVAVVAVIGSAGDPQGLAEQTAILEGAGAEVFASNAEAVRFAALLARPALAETLLGDPAR
ncbi:MAG: acyl-CoA synthetase FdrA [Alphaproteobacteria bacterium]